MCSGNYSQWSIILVKSFIMGLGSCRMAGIRVNASFYRFEFRVFRVTKEFFDSFVGQFIPVGDIY